jgi:hypothetical protein
MAPGAETTALGRFFVRRRVLGPGEDVSAQGRETVFAGIAWPRRPNYQRADR